MRKIDVYIREQFFEARIKRLRNLAIMEYLIKWKKFLAEMQHGKKNIVYRSILSYSSVEDNTFLKKRGMLRLYISI